MNTINKKVIHEFTSLHYAIIEERRKSVDDANYMKYHMNMKKYYSKCFSEYHNALGQFESEKKGLTSTDDYIRELSNINLSKSQEIALKKIRREPVFIKLMGEIALTKKDDLQQLLGISLDVYSEVTLASENINELTRQVPKTTLQIAKEFESIMIN